MVEFSTLPQGPLRPHPETFQVYEFESIAYRTEDRTEVKCAIPPDIGLDRNHIVNH
jgi:hypothetical protein